MAVDFGDARTGIAVSDLTNTLTGQAWTLAEYDMNRLADTITAEAKSREVGTIVLGNPKNMNGTEGPRSEKSRALKALLEARTDAPVILWDERQTTVAAHGILSANGKATKRHRENVDAVAAALILEGYLGTLG
jgi:putative Holliday junction resolvase